MNEVSYALRKEMERAGLPFELTWDRPAAYFAAWLLARKAGRKISVAEACAQAGFSPDALRQRRAHNAEFAAAERWARRGVPYTPPDEPEPDTETDPALDVVVPEITTTNVELLRHPSMAAAPRVTLRAGVPVWASYRDPKDEEF